MTHTTSYRQPAIALTSLTLLAAAYASAVPITFDTFGALPQATFGGTGIPNDEVAAGSQFVFGDTTLTVALSATQRFSSPTVTSNGAGTFFATPGINTEGSTNGAQWNFNFYIEASNPTNTAAVDDFQVNLFYDFDAAPDTSVSDLGNGNVTGSILAGLLLPDFPPGSSVVQGSQNLLFNFLAADVPGIQTAPTGSFDPNENGEYTFAIQVSDGGFALETVAIKVVVPEPATAGLALVTGLALISRRRRA